MLNRPVHTDIIISFLSLWQSVMWLHHWEITSYNYQLPTSDVHIFLHNHKLITFSGSPVTTAPTLLQMSLLDTNLLYEVGVLSSTVNPRLSSSTLTGRPSLEKPFIVAKSDSNIETWKGVIVLQDWGWINNPSFHTIIQLCLPILQTLLFG